MGLAGKSSQPSYNSANERAHQWGASESCDGSGGIIAVAIPPLKLKSLVGKSGGQIGRWGEGGFGGKACFFAIAFREFFPGLDASGTALENGRSGGIAQLQGRFGGGLQESDGGFAIACLEFGFGDLSLAIFGEGQYRFLYGGAGLGLVLGLRL